MPSRPSEKPPAAPASPNPESRIPNPGSSWSDLIERAELRGPVGQLARHTTLLGIEDALVRLAIKPLHEHLAVGPMVAQMEQRLSAALGRDIKVKFERDRGGTETPAEQHERAERERQRAAEHAVQADPLVRSLIETFDARVIPDSVRPADT